MYTITLLAKKTSKKGRICLCETYDAKNGRAMVITLKNGAPSAATHIYSPHEIIDGQQALITVKSCCYIVTGQLHKDKHVSIKAYKIRSVYTDENGIPKVTAVLKRDFPDGVLDSKSKWLKAAHKAILKKLLEPETRTLFTYLWYDNSKQKPPK